EWSHFERRYKPTMRDSTKLEENPDTNNRQIINRWMLLDKSF
ncbi:hypothetical protein G210_3192, partial [Candida maltosa Xu316]